MRLPLLFGTALIFVLSGQRLPFPGSSHSYSGGGGTPAYTLISTGHTCVNGTGGTVTTPPVVSTGGNFIAVLVAQDAGSGGTLSDSKANTWNARTTYVDGTDNQITMYYAQPAAVGTGHTFTMTGSGIVASICVATFTGAHAAPYDVESGVGHDSVSTPFRPGSITPTQANDLIISGAGIGSSNSTLTIDSGFTITDQVDFVAGQAYGCAMAYLIQTAATPVNPTWTYTPGRRGTTVQAAFKN